ncbi:Asp-tRNA(Asn)/Glu-tRNA(Gln) amidotransferase subunit GatC [Rubeoparvulum massiliense]|uniref:Asp-tRNA(Asn)/Glu-tRNA(Gln) amidotransferase subunit GatC n=1 Tax=Rubeoparvulum massiliense TaxID=1631346 RepID=UPI00065DCD50|nr:Asp-tRNA(Asn)/Glu-tRNA(Gln) amidotransferase subunit GatC [Rubeoparvulum massiliense]
MTEITKDEVLHVAALARLHLSEEEQEKFTTQLNNILDYMDQMNELDTTNVAPTSHVVPLVNVMREDEVRPSLDREDALKNAAKSKDGMFQVPTIIEE